MEAADRLENPRNLKQMPSEVVAQKPLSPILDRFKALLKEREEDLRVSEVADVPPPRPTTDEIVRLYEFLLSELTFNSKPVITDLTIIAGDQRDHGDGIADAICARIIEAPVDQKLPSLYLLDSIVKNIGQVYVRFFSARLPEVFCEAYRQVHPNLYPAMRHLFGTWSTVFPPSVLRKIEVQLQLSSPLKRQSFGLNSLRDSEPSRPTHSIHVNPKYLEARHQIERSTPDNNIQHARDTTSALQICGEKPAVAFEEYGSDDAEAISSRVGAQRLSSTSRVGRPPFSIGTENLPLSVAARPSSPFGIKRTRSASPAFDAMENSHLAGIERASPSHSGLDYALTRLTARDEETSDWQRNQWLDDDTKRVGASMIPHHNNGVELRRPRALIDAYGIDRGKPRLKVDRLDNKVASRTWLNTEEEEFDWEDMSPTFADPSRSNELLPSSLPLRDLKTRAGFGSRNGTEFWQSNLSSQAHPLSVNENTVLEDAVSAISARGSGPREAWNQQLYPTGPSQNQPNAEESGGIFQTPLPAGRISSLSGEVKQCSVDNFQDADGTLNRPSIASRSSSSGFDNEVLPASLPVSRGAWSPVIIPKSHPLPPLPALAKQKQISGQFNLMSANKPVLSLSKSVLHEQQLDGMDTGLLLQHPQISYNQFRPLPLTQQSSALITPIQQQSFTSLGVPQNLVSLPSVSLASNLLVQPLNHGYSIQGPAVASSVTSSSVPSVHSFMPPLNIPNSSLPGSALPPLPQGPPPFTSQMVPNLQNFNFIAPQPAAGSAFSGLVSSLMAQGLITLTKEAPVQDVLGVEFNPDHLKVRHESAITTLYYDLPRQCTTCGMRFKCQEEHRTHMDWHVTKNRLSKNRKQAPSRKWFVGVSMWLRGAEALGTDTGPGFLPKENVMDKKDDEELVVPADEDQNICALCGEPFEDFYSDETEEWMYKGAVYMNAPNGSTEVMERSQLGAIVHAKCRSESNVVSSVDFGQDREV